MRQVERGKKDTKTKKEMVNQSQKFHLEIKY